MEEQIISFKQIDPNKVEWGRGKTLGRYDGVVEWLARAKVGKAIEVSGISGSGDYYIKKRTEERIKEIGGGDTYKLTMKKDKKRGVWFIRKVAKTAEEIQATR